MADTVRTLSALQALLADNSSRAISPQDIRDAVISAVGFMYGRALSEDTTLTTSDIVIIGTGGESGITLTLPAAASSQYKYYCIVKVDSGAGAVAIDANESETINGNTTLSLSAQYDSAVIWCDGTEWFVLA